MSVSAHVRASGATPNRMSVAVDHEDLEILRDAALRHAEALDEYVRESGHVDDQEADEVTRQADRIREAVRDACPHLHVEYLDRIDGRDRCRDCGQSLYLGDDDEPSEEGPAEEPEAAVPAAVFDAERGLLVCPQCGDEVVEQDIGARTNHQVHAEEGFVAFSADGYGDFDHDYYSCRTWLHPVRLPDGWGVDHR